MLHYKLFKVRVLIHHVYIGGFRGGADGTAVPPFFLYFQNVFETLTLLYFASRIRPRCCILHVLKSEVFIRGGGGWETLPGPLFLNFLDPPLVYKEWSYLWKRVLHTPLNHDFETACFYPDQPYQPLSVSNSQPQCHMSSLGYSRILIIRKLGKGLIVNSSFASNRFRSP